MAPFVCLKPSSFRNVLGMKTSLATSLIFLPLSVLALLTPTNVNAKSWKVSVISDMNRSYGDVNYLPDLDLAIEEIINQQDSDLVLSTGDMVAGQKTGLDYQAMWNAFHKKVSEPLVAAKVPFAPSPGNHDGSVGAKFKVERDTYIWNWNQFPLQMHNAHREPAEQIHLLEGVMQNYPLNYAFTMGAGLFIAVDATIPGGLAFNQLDWLETVLEKGKDIPFKVIFGHMPLFPFAFQRAHEHMSGGTAGTGFHQRMEKLLSRYQVSLFLSGHHHVYYDGKRKSGTRFVSVPLLGTGNRFLLTKDRTEKEAASRGFLNIEFDSYGKFKIEAIETPTLKTISLSRLPSSISIPLEDATDCTKCSVFPEEFFLDIEQRTVFERSDLVNRKF